MTLARTAATATPKKIIKNRNDNDTKIAVVKLKT